MTFEGISNREAIESGLSESEIEGIENRFKRAFERLEAELSAEPATPEREALAQDFWYEIVGKNYEKFGAEPSPMQIRAHSMVRALGIPSGQVSALDTLSDGTRVNSEGDRVIAEGLTNEAGVMIGDTGIVSSDFRDIFPDGLSKEVLEHLDPRTTEIMRLQYVHQQHIKAERLKRRYPEKQSSYFRLTGGIDLFIEGYTHTAKYQAENERYLADLSSCASVICIEGFSDVPYGESLVQRFSDSSLVKGHYDRLMKVSVRSGFNGLFAEVDSRDVSKINNDSKKSAYNVFYRLFVNTYFKYVRREYPALAARLGNANEFRRFLDNNLTFGRGFERFIHLEQGKRYHAHSHVSDDRTRYEPLPTGLEFGQMMYSDALSAIKLHLIGKLMSDGKIQKGPIIDFQGSNHSFGKNFFLRYPEYAMEVVLRTLPELMAFRAENGLRDLKKELKNPDWPEVVRQIAKLAFARTTDDPEKIEPFFYDFLGDYGIDPEAVIPSDAEIAEVMVRSKRGAESRQVDS